MSKKKQVTELTFSDDVTELMTRIFDDMRDLYKSAFKVSDDGTAVSIAFTPKREIIVRILHDEGDDKKESE